MRFILGNLYFNNSFLFFSFFCIPPHSSPPTSGYRICHWYAFTLELGLDLRKRCLCRSHVCEFHWNQWTFPQRQELVCFLLQFKFSNCSFNALYSTLYLCSFTLCCLFMRFSLLTLWCQRGNRLILDTFCSLIDLGFPMSCNSLSSVLCLVVYCPFV
jgi:hypothetical protein